jgi:hypothetical protein
MSAILLNGGPLATSDWYGLGGAGHVEDVEDPLMKKIRQLDKLVDELAKGKAMEKVLRQ